MTSAVGALALFLVLVPAALAANGITPEEMMRVVNQQVPTPFRDIDVGTVLQLNLLDFAKTGALLPWRMAKLARTLAPQWRVPAPGPG